MAWVRPFDGFNSRPHVAGDDEHRRRAARVGVSIHARTWRATPWTTTRISSPACFNSRPHVAGDQDRRLDGHDQVRFNSRPHVAGDSTRTSRASSSGGFNSRPHVAGDITFGIRELEQRFQFTPARGGRLGLWLWAIPTTFSFNSRPHVAGDKNLKA